MAPEGILNFFLGKRGWLKRNGERYLCASWVWGCISEVKGENRVEHGERRSGPDCCVITALCVLIHGMIGNLREQRKSPSLGASQTSR